MGTDNTDGKINKGTYINDTIHGLIYITELEKKIISSAGFNRLHDVYQNSTAFLTFPTNRTKRFEHSIGVADIVSRMFYASILNGETRIIEKFYDDFRKSIEGIQEVIENSKIYKDKFTDIAEIYNYKITDRKALLKLTPNNVPAKYENVHFLVIQAIRIAALLHDVGHPPFSHITEFALENVYAKMLEDEKELKGTKNKESRNDVFLEYYRNIVEEGSSSNHKAKLHEKIGESLTKEILFGLLEDTAELEKANQNIQNIIILECVLKIMREEGRFGDLHRLIDSSLDADRLDYCSRDLLNSGLNVGKIDYERIINEMKIFEKKEVVGESEIVNRFLFCPPVKAINAIEEFFKRRNQTYRNVIWHHRVIKTDLLLKKILEKEIITYLKSENSSKQTYFNELSELWEPLNEENSYRMLKIVKWNDSWLINTLRNIYNDRYCTDKDYENSGDKKVHKARLDEFLFNTKKYHSIIKRVEDAKKLDEAIWKELQTKKDEICSLRDKINARDIQKGESKEETTSSSIKIDIDGILKFITTLFETDEENENKSRLLLNDIDIRLPCLNITMEHNISLTTILEKIEKKFNEDSNIKNNYDDIMFKTVKFGTPSKEEVLLYEGDRIKKFSENSGVLKVIELENSFIPYLFIYALPKEIDSFDYARKEELIEKVGTEIADNLAEEILKSLRYLDEITNKE